MRNLIYIISVTFCVVFTSCFEEKENWYSETSTMDGRYVVATSCAEYSDDDTSIEDGEEVMIYNSSTNVKDEIWIDTHVAGSAIKGKFKIKGDASHFEPVEAEVENVNSESFYIDTDYGLAPFNSSYASYFRVPTAAGQLNDGVQLYTRISLIEGKILPKGATTIGGNVSDSIYIKAVMHHDYMKFISYEIPEKDWADPEVPEFAWKVQEGSNTPADPADWDETWTLTGYRYTGYPEDM